MRIFLVADAASALAPLTKRPAFGTPGRIVAVRSAYDVEGGDTSSAPYDIEEPAARADERRGSAQIQALRSLRRCGPRFRCVAGG